MKRSPGPMPCSALTTKSAASDSAISDSTRCCMRSVSASRGRWTPGRSTSTSCVSRSVATPRMARRVVWGLSETIATLRPTMPFTSVDLPTFGRPASATKPLRVAPKHLGLHGQHLAVVGLVVEADEMQRSMHDRLPQVPRVLRADDDVTQLARPGGRFRAVDGEREDVGGPFLAPVPGVQTPDLMRVDERHRDVTRVHAPACEG